MDFQLSEEQRQIRDTLADFAEREIKPHSAHWDKEGIFPRKVVAQLGELGFLGVAFPEKYGGGGAGIIELAVVAENVGKYLAPVPFVEAAVATTVLASTTV